MSAPVRMWRCGLDVCRAGARRRQEDVHETARFYDATVAGRITRRRRAGSRRCSPAQAFPGAMLLDVACGTGGHVPYLHFDFAHEGLILILSCWRSRVAFPGYPSTRPTCSISTWDADSTWSPVSSAPSAARTPQNLNARSRMMARHLLPWRCPRGRTLSSRRGLEHRPASGPLC